MPFKTKDEKIKYIISRVAVVRAMNNDVVPAYDDVTKIADQDTNYEAYHVAKEWVEAQERSEKAYQAEIEDKLPEGQKALLTRNSLARIPRYFYDNSGTPEAKAWNERLMNILSDSVNGPKRFMDLCCKHMLEFDDSIFAKSAEEIEEYVLNHPKEMSFAHAAIDFVGKLDKFYDMKNPKEAAIVNAVRDKYAHLQSLSFFRGKYEYEANRISLILPKITSENHTDLANGTQAFRKEARKALDDAEAAYKANQTEENKVKLEEAQATFEEAKAEQVIGNSRSEYENRRQQHEKNRATNEQMVADGILGRDGIYKRSYREVDGKKEYLSHTQVLEAYQNNERESIKVEEVSAEERGYIDSFMKETMTVGKPLWENQDTKRKMATIIRTALTKHGYTMTDEQFEHVVNDDSRDNEVIENNAIKEELTIKQRSYQIYPFDTIKNSGRLATGFNLIGDSEEVKAWNEQVSLLAQTPEGLTKLAQIAAKRLLSIDMGILTENDPQRRIQYLREHPLERGLVWVAGNLTDAYQSTLTGPEEEKKKNPVVRALRARAALIESFQDDLRINVCNANRVTSLLPPLIPGQVGNGLPPLTNLQGQQLLADIIATQKEMKDPSLAPLFEEIQGIATDYNISVNAVTNSNIKATAKSLYNRGVLNENSIYQRIYFDEPERTTTGEVRRDTNGKVVVHRRECTINEMILEIANDPTMEANFRFVDRRPEAKAQIDSFLEETPNEISFDMSPEEKERYRTLREARNINVLNDESMNHYAARKSIDKELDPELRELYANAHSSVNRGRGGAALAKAFRYVNDHRAYSSDPLEQEKLEVALTTIAMQDGKCAKNLVERINKERTDRVFKKPTIDLDAILAKSGIKPGTIVDKQVHDFTNPFDKRMLNVKEIYKHLSNDLSPWYHDNGEAYEKMMQAMKNALEYAVTSGRNADTTTVEALLEDVKNASKDYLLSKDAKHTLGQNRKVSALAMVAAIDPEEGKKLLDQVSEERRAWAEKLCEKISKARGTVTTDDLITHVGVSKPTAKQPEPEAPVEEAPDKEAPEKKVDEDDISEEEIDEIEDKYGDVLDAKLEEMEEEINQEALEEQKTKVKSFLDDIFATAEKKVEEREFEKNLMKQEAEKIAENAEAKKDQAANNPIDNALESDEAKAAREEQELDRIALDFVGDIFGDKKTENAEAGKQQGDDHKPNAKQEPDVLISREELKKEALPDQINKEALLRRMMEDINRTQDLAQYSETPLEDRIELTAQYMVKKRIYNSLKADTIDKQSIAANMSKFKIQETADKVVKDDVYQAVVKSLGIKLDDTDRVEREFMKRKMEEAEERKRQNEAIEKAKEKELAAQKEKENANPEVENPAMRK